MASGTTTQGKEKRSGTSSFSNPTRSSRQSSSASKPSIDKEKEKPEKPLPNYLKPTISSRNESFKLVKKNNTREQDQKFLRRRSFDSRQLPSSSSSQKAPSSPARRDTIGPVLSERKITVRSTSHSSRTNSSASKMVLDSVSTTSSRTTKGAAVKSQPLPSGSAKKSATSSTNHKKEHNVPPSVDDASSSHTLENETKEEENEYEVHEIEEVVKAETEVDVQSDVPKPETVEDVVDDIPRETEVRNNDEKFKSCDISTVSESENVVQPAAPSLIEETVHEEEKSNEVDDVPQQETSKEEVRELEESTGNSTTLPEENIVEEAKTEVGDQKVVDDNENNKTEDQLESTEDAVGDQETEVVEEMEQQGEVEESEQVKAKEEKEKEQEQVEEANKDDEVEKTKTKTKTKTKQENAPANLVITSKRQDEGQGKKESPTAYNDVIEETASRLLEKRKNKVRALVGAFETVIDYESASTPKGSN
ncbi:eukaryotic translation initiation factor 5B [Pistacia vera]|uniref:eukaryotic translation initiation factor 5B n=1 Tax=Pistacia vera TaxID=55513 RepID=UPI00126332A6|nr:eukaryotic translation initiation factor 5B [Pistacia vera]